MGALRVKRLAAGGQRGPLPLAAAAAALARALAPCAALKQWLATPDEDPAPPWGEPPLFAEGAAEGREADLPRARRDRHLESWVAKWDDGDLEPLLDERRLADGAAKTKQPEKTRAEEAGAGSRCLLAPEGSKKTYEVRNKVFESMHLRHGMLQVNEVQVFLKWKGKTLRFGKKKAKVKRMVAAISQEGMGSEGRLDPEDPSCASPEAAGDLVRHMAGRLLPHLLLAHAAKAEGGDEECRLRLGYGEPWLTYGLSNEDEESDFRQVNVWDSTGLSSNLIFIAVVPGKVLGVDSMCSYVRQSLWEAWSGLVKVAESLNSDVDASKETQDVRLLLRNHRSEDMKRVLRRLRRRAVECMEKVREVLEQDQASATEEEWLQIVGDIKKKGSRGTPGAHDLGVPGALSARAFNRLDEAAADVEAGPCLLRHACLALKEVERFKSNRAVKACASEAELL